MLASLNISGQQIDRFIDSVRIHSPEITAATELMNYEMAGSRRGLTPSDPRVDVGYFPGKPETAGNKITWAVVQEFDFPSRYAKLKLLRDTNIELARIEYENTVTGILGQSREMAIDLIAERKLLDEYIQRMELFEKLEESYREMVDNGTATILEYNKVRLSTGEMEAMVTDKGKTINSMIAALDYISGGNSSILENAEYPNFSEPDRDSLLTVRRNIYPAFIIPEKRKEVAEKKVGVEKTGKLPAFGIGYASESVSGEQFIGPTLGVTIPLWQNRGNVDAAKAMLSYQMASSESELSRLEMEFNYTFDSWESVRTTRQKLDELIGSADNAELLKVALDSGEISLVDYIIELTAIYSVKDRFIETEKEYYLLLSAIYEHELASR